MHVKNIAMGGGIITRISNEILFISFHKYLIQNNQSMPPLSREIETICSNNFMSSDLVFWPLPVVLNPGSLL